MSGQQILLVDDTPVNLKLTRILLINEGYKVITAASAEEALELLKSYRPNLILADIQLPGMDGLELTRRVKKDKATKDIPVVALTAFAMKGDEEKALEAGCDGYITKPIDTRTLGARIREHLGRRNEGQAPAVAVTTASEGIALPAAELSALRNRFLSEGREIARNLLLHVDGTFDSAQAAKSVHQWIGTGGLLGYSSISRLSREVEALLVDRPLDNSQLRESLANLVMAFSSPREARDAVVPDSILQTLSKKLVAVAGFPVNEEERMCAALELAHAELRLFDATSAPEGAAECDLIVVHVNPATIASAWLCAASPIANYPVVLAGNRDDLLGLDPAVQSLGREFLMDAWQPEEALVRMSLALTIRPVTPAQTLQGSVAGPITRAHVVIADDDLTVLALVRTALENFGMDCRPASDGATALEVIRQTRPHAAVLDVNMPKMDGYEVLAAIRAEELPVRVLLLTARQQESDILRGFTLGADDYVVKPFSPMELVARLKRLLAR
jgi:two-component system cell cycle response regulator DivK